MCPIYCVEDTLHGQESAAFIDRPHQRDSFMVLGTWARVSYHSKQHTCMILYTRIFAFFVEHWVHLGPMWILGQESEAFIYHVHFKTKVKERDSSISWSLEHGCVCPTTSYQWSLQMCPALPSQVSSYPPCRQNGTSSHSWMWCWSSPWLHAWMLW